jgi:RNA polymerase sigma-70 factor (ECF subfamily)
METAPPLRTPEAPDQAEASLVEALRRGDADAYEQTVRRYGGRLLATAKRLLGNEADAADAVQDAFLSAFRHINQYEGQSRLYTWLHRILVNAALKKLRSRKGHPEQSIEGLLPRFRSDGHHAEALLDWRDPLEDAQREETRATVRQAIDQLPESYRTILLLRDIEELDTEETARLLGLNEGAMKSRLHRAREALRTLLDRHLRREKVP